MQYQGVIPGMIPEYGSQGVDPGWNPSVDPTQSVVPGHNPRMWVLGGGSQVVIPGYDPQACILVCDPRV